MGVFDGGGVDQAPQKFRQKSIVMGIKGPQTISLNRSMASIKKIQSYCTAKRSYLKVAPASVCNDDWTSCRPYSLNLDE